MKHSRNLCIGPGGRKCNCCFPAPSSKARRLEYRKAKKLDRKEALRIEEMHASGRTKVGNDISGI
jgi:hypothetical protein